MEGEWRQQTLIVMLPLVIQGKMHHPEDSAELEVVVVLRQFGVEVVVVLPEMVNPLVRMKIREDSHLQVVVWEDTVVIMINQQKVVLEVVVVPVRLVVVEVVILVEVEVPPTEAINLQVAVAVHTASQVISLLLPRIIMPTGS